MDSWKLAELATAHYANISKAHDSEWMGLPAVLGGQSWMPWQPTATPLTQQ